MSTWYLRCYAICLPISAFSLCRPLAAEDRRQGTRHLVLSWTWLWRNSKTPVSFLRHHYKSPSQTQCHLSLGWLRIVLCWQGRDLRTLLACPPPFHSLLSIPPNRQERSFLFSFPNGKHRKSFCHSLCVSVLPSPASSCFALCRF